MPHSLSVAEKIAVRLNRLPLAIHDAFPAVLFGRTLTIACRLGIFEVLRSSPIPAREVASRINASADGTTMLLSSLVAGGYLRRSGNRFALMPQARKWLVRSSPHYLGHFLDYLSLLYEHWNHLEETIRSGKPAKSYFELFSPREWEIYTLGMMDLAKLILPEVLPHITLPANGTEILDLGGSHGVYGMALCDRKAGLRSTVVDMPQVLEITDGIIRKRGMEDRVILMRGDIRSLVIADETYDLVLAFNILHGFTEEDNRTIVRNISRWLRPGGCVYILDQLESARGTRIERLLPLMMGLNLLNEAGGRVYRFDDIAGWCRESGLTSVRRHVTRLPAVSLIRAAKR